MVAIEVAKHMQDYNKVQATLQTSRTILPYRHSYNAVDIIEIVESAKLYVCIAIHKH